MDEASYLDWWIKSESDRTEKLALEIEGIQLIIDPKTFNPSSDVTYSTKLVLDHFPDVKGKEVLDLGTGSGIIALTAAKRGAKSAIGADIDKKVLHNSLRNAELNGLESNVTFVWSDLFQVIEKKFDYIIANLPILDEDSFSTHRRLLDQYDLFLKRDGFLLFVYASFGDRRIDDDFIAQFGIISDKVEITAFGVQWYLYTLKSNKG